MDWGILVGGREQEARRRDALFYHHPDGSG